MTSLRQRMTEDMQVRNLALNTQTSYLQQVSLFARHFEKSPEQLGPEHIRNYQVYLTNEKKLAPGSVLIAVAALRFLYKVSLHRKWSFGDVIPAPKKPQTLPVVLSPEEVLQFLGCVPARKHHAILTTCYAAGLRISEAVRLTVPDIDSARLEVPYFHVVFTVPRREKGKALFEAVRAAYQQGLTKQAIARRVGITRTTVRRLLKTEEFSERAPRQQRSGLDDFRPYLESRWAEGCHNASQLCRELRQRGYGGRRSRVKEYVQPWRARSGPAVAKPRRTLPNVRLVAFWLTKPPSLRAPEEQLWVATIAAANPQVAAAEQLAQQFRQMFKERNPEAFKSWLIRGQESNIPEVMSFIAGIHRDYDAVLAAVEQRWSNGQVEGQVHRLKLIKRQMYGRGGFQLLRQRVLPFQRQCTKHSP